MEPNDFIVKLKADGSPEDHTDLNDVFQEYKEIIAKLTTKDRGPFSLNVLCILSRNLEKFASWHARVDCKDLLTISIDCSRETRGLNRAARVKTLACMYHIHRHVVRQTSPAPPELVLKISYMPFELEPENLLNEYCKTYWNILADRLTFIEKLKTNKMAIHKLLQKLGEDVSKTIQIYDSVQFCTTMLTFLMKKLHSMYSECHSTELNKVFGTIFETLSKKNDLALFKKLKEKELLDMYTILSECLYVIAENASKAHFKDSVLDMAIRTCISLIGHRPELFHCLQTFYLNSFCSLLSTRADLNFTEAILNSLLVSCEMTENLGYKLAMDRTYPFVCQFLRLYIDYSVANSDRKKWNDHFNDQIQGNCLKLILLLIKKLKNCEQQLKCDNCKVKSGLHDSLRVSFLTKHFVTVSISQNIDVKNILPVYFTIVLEQHKIINELCALGCYNYDKCYKKLQADIHNIAIALNKALHYEYSIQLFDVYLKNEIQHFRTETDLKNISRALYNKAICELDCKLYENALKNAYLSLVFAQPEGLKADKYMSLVMDIKAKILKVDDDENDDKEDLQMMTVLHACDAAIKDNCYGNLKPFFFDLDFGVLLKHEFSMYVKLWPSIVPVAGVWKALYDLWRHNDVTWLKAKQDTERVLHEVVLETPTAVRTVHNDHYSEIVTKLLQLFHEEPPTTAAVQVVQATLLFLKAEFDLADASQKHGWKVTEPSMDPDNAQGIRSVAHEYEATKAAVRGLDVWMEVVEHLDSVPARALRPALQTAQVGVARLLHVQRTAHGLQLAHVCCRVAEHIGDDATYVRNAGTLLYHARAPCGGPLRRAARRGATLPPHAAVVLTFLCDAAIYYANRGEEGMAAKLVQIAQARLLRVYDTNAEVTLELAVGRLLEAQARLALAGAGAGAGGGAGLGGVSVGGAAQRHYLAVANTATRWAARRYHALTLKRHAGAAGACAARACAALGLARRARACAGAALPAAAAPAQAALLAAVTDTYVTGDAQIKIDSRLKYILGLQSSSDTRPYLTASESKNQQMFTPKQDIETMLENITFKKNQPTSPTVPYLIPGFIVPEFLLNDANDSYACAIPSCLILACETSGLEASMYFRSKEFAIARNYFEGTLKTFDLVDAKLKSIMKDYRSTFEKYIVDSVEGLYDAEFKRVQIKILIEFAMFELTQENYEKADEKIVRIHEIIQECGRIDPYLNNEVMNLLIASARLRKATAKPDVTGLEAELESLKLSPKVSMEPPKTPEAKPTKPPTLSKLVVKDEELPNPKRRVIKLNLDEATEETEVTTKKRTSKRTQFKIPVPVTSKHVLESLTPRPSRSKPDILITQPSEDKSGASIFDFATPKPCQDMSKSQFFTPQETPEQFFTPMTSVRTYTKKTLHKGIIKNLEAEFSTPKAQDKENKEIEGAKTVDKGRSRVETGSVRSLKDKRALKRATSPGKLEKEEKVVPRSRRLRQPVKSDENSK